MSTLLNTISRSKSLFQHRRGGTRQPLIWGALIAFLLHRAWLTLAAIQSASRFHVNWTWYQVLVHDYRHWDAGWYIEIAKHGYTTLAQTAFFPFFPILLRLLHDLTGKSYPLVGTALSSGMFILSLYLLGVLVEKRKNLSAAFISMALLASFPMSFFFDSIYTESLFLALTLLAVYQSSIGKFWSAGCFALLASLTKNTGVFIDFILFFDYLAAHQMGIQFWRQAWWSKVRWDVLSLLFAPLGIVLYMAWSYYSIGNPLAFIAAEHLWHRHYMGPWWTWYHTLQQLQAPHPISFNYNLLELTSFTFVISITVFGIVEAKRSLNQFGWWLYLASVTFIASSEPSLNIHDYLLSFPRFVLMLFPIFVYLPVRLRPKWLAFPMIAVFAGLLFFYAGIFTRGVWIA